ncbi:MAG: hypothetical protein KDC44_14005 [Phaeodactylibacter sp.]|nr:hypothetical protein [Phaeodactylibacter sp.]
MKKLFFLGSLFLMTTVVVSAQQQDPQAYGKAQEMTSLLAQAYNLDENQTDKMFKIQIRKYNDINLVASLRDQDQQLYVRKMNAIFDGANASIERMLTKAQQPTFRQQAIDLRKRKAEMARQLQAQGIAPKQIELALVEME